MEIIYSPSIAEQIDTAIVEAFKENKTIYSIVLSELEAIEMFEWLKVTTPLYHGFGGNKSIFHISEDKDRLKYINNANYRGVKLKVKGY